MAMFLSTISSRLLRRLFTCATIRRERQAAKASSFPNFTGARLRLGYQRFITASPGHACHAHAVHFEDITRPDIDGIRAC